MRLIDADALIERKFILHDIEELTHEEFEKLVNEQPTTFDTEKVVAELQKEIEWAENHGKSIDFRKGRLSGLRTAIRISRNGGAT